MPVVDVYNIEGQVVDQISLRDDIFDVTVKIPVLHQVVLYQLAKRRAGTAKTKTRAEVSGGGRKPWRQKGTGRARAGSIRSPLWRGGGVVHGPRPRSYAFKVPKKMRRLALKMALTQRLRDSELTVLDALRLERVRTKDMVAIVERFGWEKPLIVIPERDDIVEKSARNIPDVKVLRSEGLNVYDILKFHHLVLTRDTVKRIEEFLGR
ncbi:50S ribosomal protein L4 [Thermodesulforhabdus norvegica]|uniref:Large ribosomal subunit protein uL4 n=1 Tax=Thermodesulforhabdus norvegica TaxID=39841 RepID=A0A1I4VNC1_9BACT|nr:50S ribosomal protein L4 [Thermodesulforhabdus norvegica]SFN02754.1 LSU ribosomal protein L4P [Thermodesulforhabdus norvegica]